MIRFFAAFVLLFCTFNLRADGFFNIEKLTVIEKKHSRFIGIWKEVEKNGNSVETFYPSIELVVKTKEEIESKDIFTKLYFYDSNKNLLETIHQPSQEFHSSQTAKFRMPFIFKKSTPYKLYFEIPAKLIGQDWTVLAVFGGQQEIATVLNNLETNFSDYEFEEKMLLNKDEPFDIDRSIPKDPIQSIQVTTQNPLYPKFTLFLCYPDTVKTVEEIKGVLCISLLGDSADDIRHKLEDLHRNQHDNYANKNKLLIIGWGARLMWDAHSTLGDEYDSRAKESDRMCDAFANGWERGILKLSKTIGFEPNSFLMYGESRAAQFAVRLALRKPQYFLAVHSRIASSYDFPTAEGKKILWLVTKGDADDGYENAIRFYETSKKMGYPIIFKVYNGLTHTTCSSAINLENRFFDYALSLKEERAAYDHSNQESPSNSSTNEPLEPWPQSFKTPAYTGDYINQTCLPTSQSESIPERFRVSIPTKQLSEAWIPSE